jgi:hypothetical protein
MTRTEARRRVREMILDEIGGRLAEIPANAEVTEMMTEVWAETTNAMGRRLAALYGLHYPERGGRSLNLDTGPASSA